MPTLVTRLAAGFGAGVAGGSAVDAVLFDGFDATDVVVRRLTN